MNPVDFSFFDDWDAETKELHPSKYPSQTDYSDFDHHDLCRDCVGTGVYTGLNTIDKCSCCDGAGWVQKGDGIGEAEAKKRGLLK